MNDKISLRQAMILLLCMTYSPVMRFVPYFTSYKAKQAAWLTPFISSIVLLLLVFIISSIYKKYKDKEVSFMDILTEIFGKVMGKVIILMYLIFMTVYLAFFARYYCERLISTTYNNVDIKVFLIAMLVLIAVALRYRLVIIARMSEVVFLILLFIFISITTVNISNVEISRLTPISTADIVPVLEGSIGVTSLFLMYPLMFLFSDKINNISGIRIRKIGIQLVIFYTIVLPLIVGMVIGTLNYSTVQRSPIPYLVSVKQVSLFQTIEKIDSIVVGIWILSDFFLLSIFAYISIHLLRFLFSLKEEKYLINIYLTFIFIFTLAFTSNSFELDDYGRTIQIYVNYIFGIGFPVLALIVGKIRKII